MPRSFDRATLSRMDDPPTPRTSDSFAVFHDEAVRVAAQLSDEAIRKEKVLERLDLAGARRCLDLAAQLRDLAHLFARWPSAPAETVALERQTLTVRLLQLTTEARTLLVDPLAKTEPPR